MVDNLVCFSPGRDTIKLISRGKLEENKDLDPDPDQDPDEDPDPDKDPDQDRSHNQYQDLLLRGRRP